MKKELKDREKKCKGKRGEMGKGIKELERKVKEMEEKIEGKYKNGEGKEGAMESILREIEKRIQISIRERERGGGRNIVVKEVKVRNEKRREAIEEILENIGARVKVQEVWRIKEYTERSTDNIEK